MKLKMGVFSALGTLTAIASIVSLISYGFHFGWIAPFRLVIEYYENFMRFVFGWAEPPLQAALAYVNARLGWHLHLLPHWKHVFVLLWLYFISHSKAVFKTGPKTAVILAVSGIVVSLATALVIGAAPLEGAPDNVLSTLRVPLILAGAVYCFWLGTTRLVGIFVTELRFSSIFAEFFAGFLIVTRTLLPSIFLVAVIFLSYNFLTTQLPAIAEITTRSFLLLVAFCLGLVISDFTGSMALEGFDPNKIAGGLMLRAIGGAVLFVIANAGLKLAGL